MLHIEHFAIINSKSINLFSFLWPKRIITENLGNLTVCNRNVENSRSLWNLGVITDLYTNIWAILDIHAGAVWTRKNLLSDYSAIQGRDCNISTTTIFTISSVWITLGVNTGHCIFELMYYYWEILCTLFET